MTWTPEAIAHAKDARRGVVEQKPVGGKKRQARPVIVEYRYPGFLLPWAREWSKFGSYADIATAQQVIANKTRTRSHAEYRIRP